MGQLVDRSGIKLEEVHNLQMYDRIHELLCLAHKDNSSVAFSTTNVSKEELENKIYKNQGTIFIATYNDELVGMMAISIDKRKKWYCRGKTASLRFIAVHPDYKGNGIASELVDLCKEWGVKNNLQTLIWTTAYNNEAAIATAEKNAFRKADYIKFNSVQHPSIRLVLWLDKSVRNCWKLSVYYCIRKYYVSLLNQV